MIELVVVVLLCVKNANDARESGRSATGYVFATLGLWFGMEIAGILIGVALRFGILAYILGLLFAVIGGVISRKIVNNLDTVDYTARAPLIGASGITVTRKESISANPLTAWDIFLNGVNIGRIENSQSLTTHTNRRQNVLTARSDDGVQSPPFEFSVGSGVDSVVSFSEGRFGTLTEVRRYIGGRA